MRDLTTHTTTHTTTLSLYMEEAADHRLLTRDEERALFSRLRAGAEADAAEARATIWRHNQRLVINLAARYRYDERLALADLIGEGNIGLARAIDKFDPERGWKFSTYAHYWVRQAITRAIQNQRSTIRLPVQLRDQIATMRRVQLDLEQADGEPPTDRALADALGIDEARVARQRRAHAIAETVSLDTPLPGDETTTTYVDLMADPDAPAPDAEADIAGLRDQLRAALACLDARSERIIVMRYGLRDGHRHTLDEIACKYGLTRERIRQIEVAALARLRTHTRGDHPLRAYL